MAARTPVAAARPPPLPSSLSGGFSWAADTPASGGGDGADGGAAASGGAPPAKRGRRDEGTSLREKERAIAAREEQLLGGAAPQTAEDFERLLLGSPSSSYLWVRYMSFQLGLTEVEKAREVGARALRTIEMTNTKERHNVWTALLNLEKQYGDAPSLAATFKQALQNSDDPQSLHLHVANLHERAGDAALADATHEAACKKSRWESGAWAAWLGALMARGAVEQAKGVLQRAVDVLPQAKHVELISKFAQLEFKHGSAARGRTTFDGVLANYPKRVDVWSVYLDMELKAGDDTLTRRLFERVPSLRHSSKKTKFFFGRYLAYARDVGDAALVKHVKERARAWVESQAGGGDE